jgi:1-hydroxycarotenoid 3,4-desaturase
MSGDRVLVVGAGIGGLVAALELASRGLDVTLLERAAAPGGKMRTVPVDGVAQDAGPTVLTMRWVFDELFAAIGEQLDSHLRLQPCPILARHAWRGGAVLDLHADAAATEDAIGRFAGAADARAYRAFCARSREVFETLDAPFLRAPRPNPLTLAARVGLRGLPALWRIAPFRSLWAELERRFRDPRLRQLFGRYATYCGASPFAAPATLMLVTHVERVGVWRVAGGMHRLAQCLADRAAAHGVRLRCGAAVRRLVVRGGRVAGAELEDGERLDADHLVFNGDAAALRAGLLGTDAQRALPAGRSPPRSLSAWTWHLHTPAEGFDLDHHNVFFSDDSRAEFDDLFARGRVPRQPTVYVCAQDAPAADATAAARRRLLCLINAPADGDRRVPDPQELQRWQTTMLEQLAACGLQLHPPQGVATTGPADFAAMFPATGGALYGMAGHGWTATFRRPATRTRLPGLYQAGGSTHPGPGVPMAALSGRLAAAAVCADRAATSRSTWFAAATPGGMSTR